MTSFQSFSQIQEQIKAQPCNWLVTGGAGFIGSNLIELLLKLGQTVTSIDNLSTGTKENLDEVQRSVGGAAWRNFRLIEGDIRDIEICHAACKGQHVVLHQAALGSVPRSIDNPLVSHAVNVDGFLNVLVAARDAKVRRFVYASSSSVYGDSEKLPKKEDEIGLAMSPYAANKRMNEIYAAVFSRVYNFPSVGLRYFNVFGPRQDKAGQYAAVIPLWIDAMMNSRPCVIYGDGSSSRDFCYVQNVVEANLRAALSDPNYVGKSCFVNIGGGRSTKLIDLYEIIKREYMAHFTKPDPGKPEFAALRAGDVPHSLADISKAHELFGYKPAYTSEQGIKEAISWYANMDL